MRGDIPIVPLPNRLQRRRAERQAGWLITRNQEVVVSPAKKTKAPTAKRGAKKTAPEEDGQAPGNVDQIRDILFGNQMRDYERRFQRLEESLRKEVADLRTDTRSQLEALEQHLRNELTDVRANLTRESKDRVDAVRKVTEDLQKQGEETYQRIREVESDLDARAAELRDQILAQSKALAEDIQSRDERLSTELSETANELRESKVDRSSLAQLLVEVAMRISGEADEGESD